MRRRVAFSLWLAVLTLLLGAIAASPAAGDGGDGCGTLTGVACGVNAGSGDSSYHGMIAVTDQGWLIRDAARSGTTSGCGDCVWTLVLACPTDSPSDPPTSACSQASDSGACLPGQLLFRVYLSTDAESDVIQGTVCLGGDSEVVTVGADAAADIRRYLEQATPPKLVITSRPEHITVAGLPTEFTAAAPASLRPVSFGGPGVTETITLRPSTLTWTWGDGTSSSSSIGRRVSHHYLKAGRRRGTLSTGWDATYTIGYQGASYGPYDATGHLTRSQSFSKRVATSSAVLVTGP